MRYFGANSLCTSRDLHNNISLISAFYWLEDNALFVWGPRSYQRCPLLKSQHSEISAILRSTDVWPSRCQRVSGRIEYDPRVEGTDPIDKFSLLPILPSVPEFSIDKHPHRLLSDKLVRVSSHIFLLLESYSCIKKQKQNINKDIS